MEGERPVNLLSIDGGFSGLSSLFILKEVFSRIKYDIKSEEDLRPCDWFDMMIGTDTGGIVVLLLGALKLTLEQAIKAHMELEKYMPVSTSPSSDLECINNPEKFKGVFVEILKSVGLQVDSAMQASEVKGWTGKTIICTTEFSRPGALHLLRSYMPREEEAPTSTILQAACAAIASHNYFDTVAIGEGNNRLELMSALTSFANPTSVLLKEAARELGGDTWASTVISIGGRSMSSDSEGVILAQRPEEVHQYLQQRFHNVYFRLDIQHQSRNIYDNVLAYMSGASGNFLIGEAVRSLSLRQRRRTLSDLTSMKQVEVRLKPRPSVVPYFVGQKDILDALRSTHLYDSPSQSDIPTISVLTGIGGSGKTQISLKFAREYEEIYPEAPVYFVNGSSETALKCDLEAIIRSQGADYQSKTFEDAIIWLASKSRRWLMIADNVDDPSVNLTPLIPKARYGHVIITSRDPTRLGLADQGNRHRVGELEQQAAIELLLWLSSYPANSSNEILAVDIAAELGYHPLALSHAGAYIAIHGGMSSYLETYRRNRNAMMGHLSPGLLSDYNVTVAGTIEISFTRLSQASRDILHLLSHFQINSIEEEIIVKAAERGFGHIAYRSAIEPGPEIEECANLLMRMLCPNGQWSQHDFNLLLDPCLRCSLLQSGENEKSGRYFSVHPLVRSWILTQKETHVGPSMQALFIRLLASSITIGKNYEHLVFNQTLRPHIRLVDEKNVRYIGDKHAISIVLRENGDNHLAMDYVESCLVEEKALLGEDHPNTLGSMRDLSICYHKVGRYEEALEMGVKVMKLHQKILGSEHPTTLSSMRIVSICYSKVGEYDNALEMGVEAMRLCQVRLGNEHPATLSSMHNVSICYSKVGERTMALEVGVKAMELRQKILGNEHPETLSSMHNVSICYFKVGKHNDALEMAVKVMELRQKILGNEHPDTLSSMDNVSTYYSEVGKHKDALEMADKVTELRQKVLGGEHQNTLSSMHTVSTVSFAAGIYTDPIHMDVETMKLDPTPLGTEYADALTSFPYTIDSQIDSSGDPFLKLFSLQGIDVTEGGHVELHVSPILDLIDDELKAEIGELEVLSASVIRDHNEFFLAGRTATEDQLELASIESNFDPINDGDDSESTGIDGITIFQPLITSEDYYWFGHSIFPENWIFRGCREDIKFDPFCKIQCFEEIWHSEVGEDNQRDYILKPIPEDRENYEAIGYCYFRDSQPQPSLNTVPWNRLRAVKKPLLQQVTCRAELVWSNENDIFKPCHIWKVFPTENNVVSIPLLIATSEKTSPRELLFLSNNVVSFPSWFQTFSHDSLVEHPRESRLQLQLQLQRQLQLQQNDMSGALLQESSGASSPGLEIGDEPFLAQSPTLLTFPPQGPPSVSDTKMDSEDMDVDQPSVFTKEHLNPFAEEDTLHQIYSRVHHKVNNEDNLKGIVKDQDLLEFLTLLPLPAVPKGRGSRGGAKGYSCSFPQCANTEPIARKDRAVHHVLGHFGAKPFQCDYCPFRFLRKADLERHRRRNATCPGRTQPEVALPATQQNHDYTRLTAIDPDSANSLGHLTSTATTHRLDTESNSPIGIGHDMHIKNGKEDFEWTITS